MRILSLLLILAFGCTTVRPAPPPLLGPPPRVVLTEPEIELWMEGTSKIDPKESARALKESRTALQQSLAGRGLDATEPDAVLLVSERGLTRTSGRRTAQALAVAGIVLVVAAVVVAIVASSKKGGGDKKVRASPRARPAPPVHAQRARLRLAPAPFFADASVHAALMLPPPIPVPTEELEGAEESAEPEEDYIADRGYFSGDRVELTLVLQDVRTGAVLWQNVLRDSIDPRDARAVNGIVDQALANQAWASRTAPLIDDNAP